MSWGTLGRVFVSCSRRSPSLICSIPVHFSLDSDAVSYWHWGPFRNESRVLLSEGDYMASKRGGSGLRVLLDMPQEQVDALQRSIASHAHRLQFALEDMPSGDDAFEVLLKKAHLRAQGVSHEELMAAW